MFQPEMKDVKDTHQLYNTMNTNHCHIPQHKTIQITFISVHSIVFSSRAFALFFFLSFAFHFFSISISHWVLSFGYSFVVSFSIEQTIFAIQSAKPKFFHIVYCILFCHLSFWFLVCVLFSLLLYLWIFFFPFVYKW